MFVHGSPSHARILIDATAKMFRCLPSPRSTELTHWQAVDYVTWIHEAPRFGQTLYEHTAPRGDDPHLVSLFCEPTNVYRNRQNEEAFRLPANNYLALTFELIGWLHPTMVRITDPNGPRGHAQRLTYWSSDDRIDYSFWTPHGEQPETATAMFLREQVFVSYLARSLRKELVCGMANKLASITHAFYPLSIPSRQLATVS
jgi:hypothetical protein